MSFETFSRYGKPIPDIHAWAAKRGERMVHYRGRRPDGYGGIEVQEGEMPESFWNMLAWTGGWSYKELK